MPSQMRVQSRIQMQVQTRVQPKSTNKCVALTLFYLGKLYSFCHILLKCSYCVVHYVNEHFCGKFVRTFYNTMLNNYLLTCESSAALFHRDELKIYYFFEQSEKNDNLRVH